MKKNLMVILDCSGSFAENGKIEILRALRLSAAYLAGKYGVLADFFIWREEIQQLTNPKEIVAQGRSEISALEKFLATCPENSKIILLSDGQWSIDDSRKLKSVIAAREISLVFSAIGADANRSRNYAISTIGGVWFAADFPSAVQALLIGGAQ